MSLDFDVRMLANDVPAAGDYLGGDGYLALSFVTKEVKGQLARVERLSDGSTVAAILARGSTNGIGSLTYGGGSSPLGLAFTAGESKRFAHVATEGSIAWQPGWRSDVPLVATERFTFGAGVGLATYGGSLLFPSPPTTDDPLEIQPGTALAHARGDQLFYGYATSVLYSYTVAGGSVPIVNLAGGRLVVGVRTATDRLVWIDGLRPENPLYSDMRVHWSPLPKDAASVVVNDGPAFPAEARGAVRDMHANGSWVIADALFGPDGEKHRELLAFDTQTGQVYRLPNKPGRIYMRALLLTPNEIVIAYMNETTKIFSIDELVRIELATLPTVIANWNAGK